MSRILLAEDDRTLRDITVRFLSKNGLDVDVTDNGNEACTLIEKNKYDCTGSNWGSGFFYCS